MPPGPDGLIEICQKLQSGISVHSMLHLLLKDLLLLSSLNGRTFRPSELFVRSQLPYLCIVQEVAGTMQFLISSFLLL